MAYELAVLSLLIRPVEPLDEQVYKFFVRKMAMEAEVAEDLTIEEIKKIHAVHSKKSKGPMTRVIFNCPHDRDIVLSHVSSLPKDCSVEIVTPDHLRPLRKLLEAYAFKIRQHARNTGTKVSTSIHFDAPNQSLLLVSRKEGDEE